MRRLLSIVLTIVLLFMLISCTMLYLHNHYTFAEKIIKFEPFVIAPLFKKCNLFLEKNQIRPWWVIWVVLAVILLRNFIRSRTKTAQKSGSNALFAYFFFSLMAVFIIGIVAAIYYADQDNINVMGLFTIKRGPADEFLGSIIKLVNLVVAGYLFVHLTIKLYLDIRFSKVGKKLPRLDESNK